MIETLILAESEIDQEFLPLQGRQELQDFCEWAGPASQELSSPRWGLDYRGWAVSYCAKTSRGRFLRAVNRDPSLSLMYYARRFVLKIQEEEGAEDATEQRLVDLFNDLSEFVLVEHLADAEALAKRGWKH